MEDKHTSTPKKRYARPDDPVIIAAMEESFRFETVEQAVDKISNLASRYTTSKHQLAELDHPAIILWVHDYALTEEDRKNGLLGNYMFISYRRLEDGRYTLSTTKMEAERKFHPKKRPVRARHPDWNHPLLRAIGEKKTYATVEEAQAELDRFHEDYPETTIPNPGKLYAMIYQKNPKSSTIRKMVLEIKLGEDGTRYVIGISKNTYQPKARPPPAEPEGSFTARLTGKRRRKDR